MVKDFSSDQPAPETRENASVELGPRQGATPSHVVPNVAPKVGLPDTGPGEGIPPSNHVIR